MSIEVNVAPPDRAAALRRGMTARKFMWHFPFARTLSATLACTATIGPVVIGAPCIHNL